MAINSWTESYGDRYYRGYDLANLQRDECFLTINNSAVESLYLYGKYDECLGCPYLFETGPIDNMGYKTIKLNTKFSKTYRLLKKQLETSPENSIDSVYGADKLTHDFRQYGIYALNVETNDNLTQFKTVKEGVNIYFPMLTVFLIFCTLYFFVLTLSKLRNKYMKNSDEPNENENKKERIKSLDTFRGISIVLMIFVNYGHGGYPFLEHAIWNGLYVGDLVFPWFMWIMGVCIPMSIQSVLKRKVPKKDAFLTILRRSWILFGLGIFLGSGTNLNQFRVFGVLQRFAVSYLVVASLNLFTLNLEEKNDGGKIYQLFKDISKLILQWIIMLVIILIHTLLVFYLIPPSCPEAGYFGPGGYHDNGTYMGCTGGVTGYIDGKILGNHIYQHSEITVIYKSQPFDPEGILGCLTSVFHVFLGVQAGMIMLTYKSHKLRLIRWLCWACITGIIGGALCGFSKEDGIIPVNKNLWSLSFVFVTSSFAFILLSICYFIIDVKKMWSGAPFLYAGMNAIIMYCGHSLTYGNFPFHWYIGENDNYTTHFLKLINNVQGTNYWVLIAYLLYKRKFFLSI